MSFTAGRWPDFDAVEATVRRDRRPGVAVVWRVEMAKAARLARVRLVAVGCLGAPLLVALAVNVQSAVPADTLFGQWLHESGFALPMVVLSFAGQWVLPLLTAVVCGDVFSAEDQLGTWKTLLTRSCTRWALFAGKALAGLTYTLIFLVLLAAVSLLAGTLLGVQPLVGLTGQLVPGRSATTLVLASWATQLPPMVAFASIALLVSIVSRNSLIGTGVPVVAGLAMQLLSLVNLPSGVRLWLPSTPFGGWHGLWVQDRFYGPIQIGVVTSIVWFTGCSLASWIVFSRRDISVT